MSDKKIELIQQLLAKAESTTPEEAEALTEHAERLMVKYGIEQAMLDSKAGKLSEEIITDWVEFKGVYILEMIALGAEVCNGLGNLRVLQSRYKNKWTRLHIIGFKSDVERAKTLIASLQIQSAVACRAWWKQHKDEYVLYPSYDQEVARRSFVRGFASGAGERIRNSRQQVVEEAGTGTELVLVSRDRKVQDYYDSIAKGQVRRTPKKDMSSARGHGIVAGKNASMGEKGVGQRRAVSQ